MRGRERERKRGSFLFLCPRRFPCPLARPPTWSVVEDARQSLVPIAVAEEEESRVADWEGIGKAPRMEDKKSRRRSGERERVWVVRRWLLGRLDG